MINQSVLSFLKDLKKNNNREWFEANRHVYNQAREDVITFMNELIQEITLFDTGVANMDAKKSLFRIYRDTRFSRNKDPYKTNFGAHLGRGEAGYYLHIEPNKSFVAGGIYMLQNDQLKNLRQEISYNARAFTNLLEEADFLRHFGGLSEDEGKLKRIPRGFEKEDPMGEYLKLKHFIVVRSVTDKELLAEDAAKVFAERYKSLKPLNDFINTAVR